MGAGFFRHQVDTAFVPGVAGSDTAQGQPSTAPHPKAFDRRDRILGTTGRKTAMVTQPRADDQAVAFNENQNQCAHALQLYASEFPVRRITAGCPTSLYPAVQEQPDRSRRAYPGADESSLVTHA